MKCDEKLDKPRKVFYIPHIEEDVKKKKKRYIILSPIQVKAWRESLTVGESTCTLILTVGICQMSY